MTPFRKMHGLGNDFVIFDGRSQLLSLSPEQIRHIADRRRGVGCDQVIVMERVTGEAPAAADLFMRIYNPDGSEAQACGNATRCVAALLMRGSGREQVTIRTLYGDLPATAAPDGQVTVDMGPAQTDWQAIPLAEATDTLSLPITAGPLQNPVAAGMGNPHCVFFVEDAEAVDLAQWGPQVETHPLFPERTNVEVASLRPDGSLRLRVWERGAGITQACGSGACATAVAAVRRGLTGRTVRIDMDGGPLILHWRENNGHVLMTGPVADAFTGDISL